MSFTTRQYGQKAIDTLVEFAPHEVRETLKTHASKLDEILHLGMPILGTVSNLQWSLSIITPSESICLFVERDDFRPMSLAEGLLIERHAIVRARRAAIAKVSIKPRGIEARWVDDQVRDNLKRGRHWTFGLM